MTPAELKKNLLQQLDETVANARRLEGAIAACDEMLKEETTEEETVEEETDD